MLVLVCLNIVLTLMQNRGMVCAERSIGSEIVLEALDGSPMWNLILIHLVTVAVLVQDTCTVYAKRTIGTEIVSDAPDGTPR
jgi:hypothetical protein